jgi:hypothetical protein
MNRRDTVKLMGVMIGAAGIPALMPAQTFKFEQEDLEIKLDPTVLDFVEEQFIEVVNHVHAGGKPTAEQLLMTSNNLRLFSRHLSDSGYDDFLKKILNANAIGTADVFHPERLDAVKKHYRERNVLISDDQLDSLARGDRWAGHREEAATILRRNDSSLSKVLDQTSRALHYYSVRLREQEARKISPFIAVQQGGVVPRTNDNDWEGSWGYSGQRIDPCRALKALEAELEVIFAFAAAALLIPGVAPFLGLPVAILGILVSIVAAIDQLFC